MRLVWIPALVALVLAGCGGRSRSARAPAGGAPAPPASATNKPPSAPIVTPSLAPVGKIALVNTASRFVVLSYPLGGMPAQQQRLGVYRNGLKVAELKVTGPARDVNTVAEILTGDCQVGDEARAD
jgi:hypothetical protein